MAKRHGREQEPNSKSLVGKVELGYLAGDNYKARLTKGLLGVNLGEGYIVEIINFRAKKVLRRELFEDPDEARDELALIRDDIDRLTTEEFRRKFLQPPA
jgi:hypothetical protein